MKITDNFTLLVCATPFGRFYCTFNGVKVGLQTTSMTECRRMIGVDILKGWAPITPYPIPHVGVYTVDAEVVRTSKNKYFVRVNGHKMGQGLPNAKTAKELFFSIFKVKFDEKIKWASEYPIVHEEE